MKAFYFLGLISSLIFLSCTENNVITKKRFMQYDCDNDFTVTFSENSTITSKDSTGKITVKVKSPKLNATYDMHQVRSGSGSKYASKEGKYIFWEHQGEFLFGTEDSTYCLCD